MAASIRVVDSISDPPFARPVGLRRMNMSCVAFGARWVRSPALDASLIPVRASR
jgi:hypothetical protein